MPRAVRIQLFVSSGALFFRCAPLPILLIGGASERLEGGRHLRYPDGTPLANLHLSILDKLGIHRNSFGNSTGLLEV